MSLPRDQILVGDCLKALRKIPDASVDVCFADPPFNLKKRYSKYHDHKADADYLAWCEEWIRELVRVTKPTGSIAIYNIPKWLTHYTTVLNREAHFRHWISWDAMTAPMGRTLIPAHYGILFYTKSRKDFKFFEIRAPHKRCRLCDGFLKDYGGKKDQMHPFGQLVSDVWSDIHRTRHKIRRDEHPCQLPIHLVERIILMSTAPGDVVLDPFLGTGTTAIAAKQLGRRFIGLELDANYARIARQRVAAARASKLEKFYVSKFLGKVQTVRDVDAKKLFPPQLTKQQKRARRLKPVSARANKR